MRRKHLLLLVALLVFGAACGNGADRTAPSSTQAGPTTAAAAEATTTTAAPATTAEATTTTAEAAATTAAPATTAEATTTTAAAAEPEFPVTVDGLVIEEMPAAIVSLSPTATETLFAIGAGGQVAAVGMNSDHPPEAPVTDLSGFQPNLEAIAAYRPDLVIISWDPGGLEAGLTALGIPVLIQPPALQLSDAYLQMRQLGEAAGRGAEAEELVASLQEQIAELVEDHGAAGQGLTYYHEVDNTYYSASSGTFIGGVYALFGLASIADEADQNGSGYPQLSVEYILEADPDIIFFGCALWCGTTAENISERPGWSGLAAVESGALIEVDDDLSSRWGPRLIEFVRLIAESLAARTGAVTP